MVEKEVGRSVGLILIIISSALSSPLSFLPSSLSS
jgi:hypothetical protein